MTSSRTPRCRSCAQRKRRWSKTMVVASGRTTNGVFHWHATLSDPEKPTMLCAITPKPTT